MYIISAWRKSPVLPYINFKMNRIAIIGTNGFLSTAIAKGFLKENWVVDMFGLESPSQHKCHAFYRVNLVSEELDYKKLLDYDIIVYAAGAGIQSNLRESSELIYGLNVTSPIAICNGLKVVDYKGVFITFGSVFEMGETSEHRYFNEIDIVTSRCTAPNEYTVSKRVLTRFVDSYSHQFVHWHFIIPTIYGPGENPQRLIPYTIASLLKGEELHFTSGEQTRQYIYVGEIPSILLLGYQTQLCSGIYNLEGKDTLKVKELVHLISQNLGKKVQDHWFGSTQRYDVGMKYLALDGSKLYNACGFKAKVSVENVMPLYIP